MTTKPKVLFLCTGNSCRSQMAEGFARALRDDLEPYSAGIETHGLHPHAVQVMAELNIDISHHRSKLLSELQHIPFDLVITVCSHAHESCPVFPGNTKVIHAPFDDPPKLAQSAPNPQAALDCYRQVRDQIKNFIQNLKL
ncbi:MAG: arsenate reductase ArsC [Sedimentisphaerales bacterium]|nr:arsenate reductase ArsC [Sedimentisphaerales bacterium]